MQMLTHDLVYHFHILPTLNNLPLKSCCYVSILTILPLRLYTYIQEGASKDDLPSWYIAQYVLQGWPQPQQWSHNMQYDSHSTKRDGTKVWVRNMHRRNKWLPETRAGWKEIIRRSCAGVIGHFCRFSNFKHNVFFHRDTFSCSLTARTHFQQYLMRGLITTISSYLRC